MAILTIRELDQATEANPKVRATNNRRSMTAETQEILGQAVDSEHYVEAQSGLATRIHRRFAEIGGFDFELPPRGPSREPPDFS